MPFLSRVLLMLCAGSLPLVAGFVPPAEGPVPFRRDKLPVDVDTMVALSRQVTMFAESWVADEADGLRALAQMTALALALDPTNREARELIETLKAGGARRPAATEELERAHKRAWQVRAWLDTPAAGADGRALAACLGDVLVMTDPHHAKARELRATGEQGAWKSWVAEESAFRPQELAAKPEMTPEEGDPPPVPEQKKPLLALGELSLSMPIWSYDKPSEQMKLGLVAVNLEAEIDEKDDEEDGEKLGKNDDRQRSMEVAGEGLRERFLPGMKRLEAAMTARHGSLPEALQVKFNFGKNDYSFSRNGLAVTGTAALLLDGALTGKPPAAITLAVVGENGKLELPPGFWRTLRAFSPLSAGTRLILPDEAADYLTALVVMDNAAFFIKNEVLLAGTVDELCDLASPSPEAKIADGLKRFEEIRKASQGKTLGSFVAHPATQLRLRELAGVMPEHASGRMLALQGSGSRPRFLQRPILAREIRAAMEPASYLLEDRDDLDPDQVDLVQKSCREQLDKLTGYIDIRDRDLHKAAMDVADHARTLSRLLPELGWDKSLGPNQKTREAYETARREYLRVQRDLTLAAGDGADFPPPEPRKE